MRQLHEVVPIHPDAPTPQQLFTLASREIVYAKRFNKLRGMKQARNPRSHFMVPPAEVIVPRSTDDELRLWYEHKRAAVVARTGFREWSMRILTSYIVIDDDSPRGERHTYKFEWNDHQATLAEHDIIVTPSIERAFIDDIEAFKVPEDIAQEWDWRLQLRQVSAGDVSLLIEEAERQRSSLSVAA